MDKLYSKSPKKNFPTKKTDVYHSDNIWSLELLGLKDYDPETKRGYRYIFTYF